MAYTSSDAGKGSQDRSSTTKRGDCPLWKQVKLKNGLVFTPEEAAKALDDIGDIILEFAQSKLSDTDFVQKLDNWIETHYVNHKEQ